MRPILFKSDTTDFNNFGIGVLSDCLSCEVTEERNGIFECFLKYPVSGAHFDEILKERILKAKPNDTAADQLFRIYRISTPLDGVVSVYAQHISYDLANIAVMPFSENSISPALALSKVFEKSVSKHSFTYSTNHSTAKPFSVKQPQSIRACLGGVKGSFLDIWGGEYEWDNFEVTLHSKRGLDTGVVITYGKNLTDLEHDDDNTGVYTDLLPFAVLEDDEILTLPEVTLEIISDELIRTKTLIKDFSEFFSEGAAITVAALRSMAQSYINSNPLGASIPTLKISFEPLWRQHDYSVLFERVSLCDTVTVTHPKLGLRTKAKVVQTVYDSLAEKYISVTLGSTGHSFIKTFDSVQEQIEETNEKVKGFNAVLQAAISRATDLITGQTGGHVVLHGNEAGLPYELLILDTPSISTAQNVWRWNLGGLGHSKKGYNGPYTTAITSEGEIVANFITAGTFNANIIRAGTIASYDNSSYWDLETGHFKFGGISYNGTKFTIDLTQEVKDELKGDKGDKGDTGARGATGAKGDKGDKGADGNTPTISNVQKYFAVRSKTLGAPSNTSTLWKDEPSSFNSDQNLWVREDIKVDGVWKYGIPYIGSNIKLKADSIELLGYTTINDNFKIDNNGKLLAKDIKLSGSFSLDSEFINNRTRLFTNSNGLLIQVGNTPTQLQMSSARGALEGTWWLNGSAILTTTDFLPANIGNLANSGVVIPINMGGTGKSDRRAALLNLFSGYSLGGIDYGESRFVQFGGVYIRWGIVRYGSTLDSGSYTSFDINFSDKPFSGDDEYVVTATASDSRINVSATSLTATGFTLNSRNVGTTAVSTFNVNWVAVGRTAS